VGDVLLTGASGYLGIHLLRELIDSEEVIIYCMVRSKGVLTPERRLKSQLMYYFSKTFDDLFGTRIIPVDGDITNKGTLESLKGMGISTVYNCAASVKHYAAGNELEKINVEGVSNLIDFCRSDNARLIHISTISVSGVMNKSDYQNIIFNESKLFVGQKIENKYVLSKFKAERLLLQAITEGLDAKIMRVGNLMGRHSDGEFQINFRSNAFINMLKSYKVLQKFPLSRLTDPTEMSPIDCVAKAVYTLSKTPRNIVMLHAYNHYRLDMANVIYAMKEYGFSIELVSDNDFNEHFNQMMNNPQKSEYLSGLLHYGVSADTVPVPDDNRYTTLLLYKHQVRWPLADDCYSVKLGDMLDGMGFFDE
jgi:thioester reductase-like protein